MKTTQPFPTGSSTPTRFVLVGFSLVAATAYRASISFIESGVPEIAVLGLLAAILLAVARLMKSQARLERYWQLPYAFFVFTVAGLVADGMVSPLQNAFVRHVLHESPTTRNPLASTVGGTVFAQLFATLCLVVTVILLTKASGDRLSSLFINPRRLASGLGVGAVAFLVVFFLTARGRTEAFFPNAGVSQARFLALTPALVVLVVANGLREELWFRGLFLERYATFLSPFASNVLAATIFTSFHVQVGYAANLLPFLAITMVEALFLGYLMQRSTNLLASALFHAASDIPIFLAYLSYAPK